MPSAPRRHQKGGGAARHQSFCRRCCWTTGETQGASRHLSCCRRCCEATGMARLSLLTLTQKNEYSGHAWGGGPHSQHQGGAAAENMRGCVLAQTNLVHPVPTRNPPAWHARAPNCGFPHRAIPALFKPNCVALDAYSLNFEKFCLALLLPFYTVWGMPYQDGAHGPR